MFYKVLALELLLCVGLVGVKVYQSLPATRLEIGERTIVLKSGPAQPAPIICLPEPPPVAAKPKPKAVKALPAKKPAPVHYKYSSGLTFPVDGHGPEHVISVFGDKRGSKRTHKGIDIKAPRGTAVVAVADGFIETVRDSGSGGKQVYLRDGTGRLFYYAHLDSWSVAEDDVVKVGDVLGTVGDTGNAKNTTPHLHFEVMIGKKKEAIDPLRFWVGV